jgi:hypothetical protein
MFLVGSGSLLSTPAAQTRLGTPVVAAEGKTATPCKRATGSDPLASPVDQACREGGVDAAKTKMKELLRDGRRAGVRYECDDCHTADDDYSKLAKDAEEKLKKLLAALPKKQ